MSDRPIYIDTDWPDVVHLCWAGEDQEDTMTFVRPLGVPLTPEEERQIEALILRAQQKIDAAIAARPTSTTVEIIAAIAHASAGIQ